MYLLLKKNKIFSKHPKVTQIEASLSKPLHAFLLFNRVVVTVHQLITVMKTKETCMLCPLCTECWSSVQRMTESHEGNRRKHQPPIFVLQFGGINDAV